MHQPLLHLSLKVLRHIKMVEVQGHKDRLIIAVHAGDYTASTNVLKSICEHVGGTTVAYQPTNPQQAFLSPLSLCWKARAGTFFRQTEHSG
jgi:hypothetical protein